MKIKEFMSQITALYPDSLSAQWDNDGLMCCSTDAEISRVLVALDATLDVIRYAVKGGFDALVCHHPMIFKPCFAVTPDNIEGKRVIEALGGKLAVISLHTRLDSGEGGVNDMLCRALGYEGEVFGTADEPYAGRIFTLTRESALCDFAREVKEKLSSAHVEYYGHLPAHRVAVVGGAGKDYIEAAYRAGADTFLTGELSYNAMLDCAELPINVIAAGHYFTERVVLGRLCELVHDIAGAQAEVFDVNMTEHI